MSQYYRVPPQDPKNRPGQNDTQKTPSLGKTIAKVAVGALIIIVGLDDFRDFTFFMFCLVIGAAFIVWGLVPYLQALRKAKQEETERILGTPFPGQGKEEEDEAERLAKKYYNK